MTALVGIAAEPGAVPAAHMAFKLMNMCCLRPAHDVQRDGLVCVAAEAAVLEIAIPGVQRVAERRRRLSRPTSWIGPKPITQFTRDTQIPIAHAALPRCPPAVSSLGGLRTPAPVRAAPPSWGQHPKTFTEGDIKVVDPPVPPAGF